MDCQQLTQKIINVNNEYVIVKKKGKTFCFLTRCCVKQVKNKRTAKFKRKCKSPVYLNDIPKNKKIGQNCNLQSSNVPMLGNRLVQNSSNNITISIVSNKSWKTSKQKWIVNEESYSDVKNLTRLTSHNAIFSGCQVHHNNTLNRSVAFQDTLDTQSIISSDSLSNFKITLKNNSCPAAANSIKSGFSSSSSLQSYNQNGSSTSSLTSTPIVKITWPPAKRPPTRKIFTSNSSFQSPLIATSTQEIFKMPDNSVKFDISSSSNLYKYNKNGSSTLSLTSKPIVKTVWTTTKQPPTRHISTSNSSLQLPLIATSTQGIFKMPNNSCPSVPNSVKSDNSSSSNLYTYNKNGSSTCSLTSKPIVKTVWTTSKQPPTRNLSTNNSSFQSPFITTSTQGIFKMPAIKINKPSIIRNNSHCARNEEQEGADDILSLFAESIRSDTNNESSPNCNMSIINGFHIEEIDKYKATTDWLESQKLSENHASLPEIKSSTVESESVPEHIPTATERNKEVEVPVIFSRFCKKIFENGPCKSKGCYAIHKFDERLEHSLNKLSQTDLLSHYNYAKKFTSLYSSCFASFANVLVRQQKEVNFIQIIDDILALNVFDDRTPFLNSVIKALMAKPMSFEEAVKAIIVVHGTLKNGLGDMLLTLVLQENKLIEYWDLINLITQLRMNNIDHGAIEDMLKQCIDIHPVNVDIVNKVERFMAKIPQATILRIDRDILNKYTSLTKIIASNSPPNETNHPIMEISHMGNIATNSNPCVNSKPCINNNNNRYSPNFINSLQYQYTEWPSAGYNSSSLSRNSSLSPSTSCNTQNDVNLHIAYLKSYVCNSQIGEISNVLAEVYKDAHMRKVFVISCLKIFKEEALNISEIFMEVLKCSESQRPNLLYDEDWKKTIQFWGMNTIILLFSRNKYQSALTVLNRLPDSPSFVNVEVVDNSYTYNYVEYKYTYLYCILIFIKNNKLETAYEWLINPVYSILLPDNSIPHSARTSLSVIFRSFTESLVESDSENYTIYLNRLIYVLLQRDRFEKLKLLAPHLQNGLYRKMMVPILRAYIITMCRHFEQSICILLYHRGCEMNYYDAIDVKETTTSILLKTNLCTEEITIILHIFLSSLAMKSYHGRDIFLLVKNVPQVECANFVPQIIKNIDTSNNGMCFRIITALSQLHPPLSCKMWDPSEKFIVIDGESIRVHLLERRNFRQRK